jgi:hypothetical protein
MSKFSKAIKEMYRTPEECVKALGLDVSVLERDKEPSLWDNVLDEAMSPRTWLEACLIVIAVVVTYGFVTMVLGACQ